MKTKRRISPLALWGTIIGLGGFSLSSAQVISTADGNGADAQVTENDDLSGGAGADAAINTRFNNSNRNELIYLRFDTSSVDTSTVNNAVLRMRSFRDSTSYTITVYGLNDGHAGENWDEATLQYNGAPGVNFDGDSTTNDLISGEMVNLGTFSQQSTKGAVNSFQSTALSDFLETDSDGLVTLILARYSSVSGGQSRFASKEATALDGGTPSGSAGDFAPELVINASSIALTGDSTVTNHEGWGVSLGDYLPSSYTITNLAASGTSTKSFTNQGRWASTLALNADYVFIQFGHNDQKLHDPARGTYPVNNPPNVTPGSLDLYRSNLASMAQDVIDAGGTPVILTSVARRGRDANGDFQNEVPTSQTDAQGNGYSLLDYANAAKTVAMDKGAILIDLNQLSLDLYQEMLDNGEDITTMGPPGDNTHFNATGAAPIAEIVAEEFLKVIQTTSQNRSTADGNGADAQVSENDDVSSGSGTASTISARYSNATRNELIYLRFDTSTLDTSTVNNAELRITSYRDATGYDITVYGLNDGHAGESWDEASIEYNGAPGVNFDGDSTTNDLIPTDMVNLGSFTPQPAKGAVNAFQSTALNQFIETDSDGLVTLILARYAAVNSGQSKFASKEATSLDGGSPTGAAGDFAPELLVNIPTVSVSTTDAITAESPQDDGVFTITRDVTDFPLTVSYTLTGDAENGTDYAAHSGMVCFPAGVASVQIQISPIDDGLSEYDEDVTLTLKGGDYHLGTQSSAQLIIPGDLIRIKAFPTAEGAGAYALGGRGGDVYYVTNLLDYDAGDTPIVGSLRHAIDQTGPRTIVFQVSGIIDLARSLNVTEPFLTIAGQTAPGDGICLRNYGMQIFASDVIMRHIRIRVGDQIGRAHIAAGGTDWESDAISVRTPAKNVILDHCSFSWGNDEVCSVSGVDIGDISVQWCFITESLNDSTHAKGTHGYGSLIRTNGKVTFHHNLWAFHTRRSPRPGTYPEDAPLDESILFDCRNNFMYMGGVGDSNGVDHVRMNFVNNYHTGTPYVAANSTYSYRTGNIGTFNGGNTVASPYSVNTVPVTTQSATGARTSVMYCAGATLPARDAVDQRVIGLIETNSGAIIDSADDVGGWPTYSTTAAPLDTDVDGMPDNWELLYGLDPNDATDRNTLSVSGYTMLEEYLNGVSLSEGTYAKWQALQIWNGSDQTDTADPDADGIENLMEYALNLDPLVDDSHAIPCIQSAGGGLPHYRYRRNIAAGDLAYEVQSSTTLLPNNWSPYTGSTSASVLDEQTDLMEVQIDTTVSPKKFFRLKVSYQ